MENEISELKAQLEMSAYNLSKSRTTRASIFSNHHRNQNDKSTNM